MHPRDLRTWATLALLTLTVTGCASEQTPYTPNDKLVENIGTTSATQQLQEVLRRAAVPQITTVEIVPDQYTYVYEGDIRIQWHKIASVYENQIEVFFSTIARIDLFEDHQAVVISTRDTEIDRHQFTTRDDCELFADLVMSFVALDGEWPADEHAEEAAEPDSVLEGNR